MSERDNSGALFQNKDKKDKQPDYRGECVVNGKTLEIAGWKKQSKNGLPYLSLSFKEPYKKEEKRGTQQAKATRDDDDSLVPF